MTRRVGLESMSVIADFHRTCLDSLQTVSVDRAWVLDYVGKRSVFKANQGRSALAPAGAAMDETLPNNRKKIAK